MKGCIEVTHADLRLLVQAAYNLSKPQGMGFLHYKSGPLSDEDADQLLECRGTSSSLPTSNVIISLDYVKGRAVFMTVFKEESDSNEMFIRDTWFDHSKEEFDTFLEIIGVQT